MSSQDDERATIYDSLDHHIQGVTQQQAGLSALSFRSPPGVVRADQLPRVAEYAL
jgi:hypothetical protein